MREIDVVTAIDMSGQPTGDTERVDSWLHALSSLGFSPIVHTIGLTIPSGDDASDRCVWSPEYSGHTKFAKLQRWVRSLITFTPPWITARTSRELSSYLAKSDRPALLLGGGAGVFAQAGAGWTHWDVVNVVGSSSKEEISNAPTRLKWMYLIQHLLSLAYEKRILNQVNSVSVTTQEEFERLHHLYGTKADAVIPSIPPQMAPLNSEVQRDPSKILWLGSFSYSANWHGLTKFLDDADPVLAEAGMHLLAVGSNLDEWQSEFLTQKYKSVKVIGFVKDLREVAAHCSAICIPLWAGAGLKIKTLVAAQLEIPIVGTRHALEGFPEGSAVCMSDDVGALANTLVKLKELDVSTSTETASRFVRTELNSDVFAQKVREILLPVGS